MVNVRGGEIVIDGYNINSIGLDALRSSLALVPQDSTLFRGPLRDNLSVFFTSKLIDSAEGRLIISSDPQRSRTDAELISALQRAYLLPTKDAPDPVADAKFGLDAVVGDEGDICSRRSPSACFSCVVKAQTTARERNSCWRSAELWSRAAVSSFW